MRPLAAIKEEGGMQLRSLQKQFASEVLNGVAVPKLRSKIFERGLEAERRLQIYKNNISSTLIESLQKIYPVTTTLVGEEYFKYLGKQFVKQHPPTCADLHDYGVELPTFISSMESLSHLGYLSAIARIDWACHIAFHASKSDVKALDCLTDVRPESYEFLIFHPHPSVRLVNSSFPVFDIWSYATGDDTEDEFEITPQGQSVLILRKNQRVKVIHIEQEVYQFLSLVLQKEKLGTIIISISESNSEYNLEFVLHKIFSLGVISDVTVQKHHKVENNISNNV